MRAFHFGLESVLSLRKMKEEEALRRFISVKNLHQKKREALDRIFETRRLAQEEMGAKEEGSVDVKTLLQYQRYLAGLVVQIAAARAELVRLEKELAARREILTSATKDRKVMEKAKEKRFAEWREEFRRAEQKETDEVGTQIYLRDGDGEREP
ncbi:MAG: flagellar export protein FliJ [Planctomycetes bacterium]|nr:flagellar export protein FliJ [Planctomycetota bacterium]